MFIKWTEELRIGVNEIDEEHKAIIDRFETLYEQMRLGKGHEYYMEMLEFLDQYVETHFRNEEKLQEDIDYYLKTEHKAIHNQFREQVKTIKQAHADGQVTNKELLELNLFVKNWLVDHIMIADRKIGIYYSKLK